MSLTFTRTTINCALIVFMSISWTVQCYEMVLMELFCLTNGNYSQREITAEMFFDLLSNYSKQKHMQTFSCCFRRITSSSENMFLWQLLCEEENTPRINKTKCFIVKNTLQLLLLHSVYRFLPLSLVSYMKCWDEQRLILIKQSISAPIHLIIKNYFGVSRGFRRTIIRNHISYDV